MDTAKKDSTQLGNNDCKYITFIDYLTEKNDQVSCSSSGRFRRKPVKEILLKYAKSGDASEEEKKEIEELLKNL